MIGLGRFFWFFLFVLCFPFLVSAAQQDKLYLSADSITHLRESNQVVAEGDVHITYGGYVLSADSISVFQDEERVVAKGNVRLLRPSGEALFSDYAELQRDLSSGVVQALKMVFANGERFTARAASLNKKRSQRYILEGAGYTPCQLCLSDETQQEWIPWTIHADEVIHDKQDQVIRYYNAFLSIFGVPIFYVPYFSHPEPSIERQSGFLRPLLARSSLLGTSFGLPFYFAPNPSFDMTLTPVYYSRTGWLFDGELRWRTPQGGLTLEGAVIGSDVAADPQKRLQNQEETRGYGRAIGQFGIDRNWRWGWDVYHASDDTYLRRYDIDNDAQVIAKTAYIEGFFQDDYLEARVISFQDLRFGSGDDDDQILPFFSYHYESGEQFWGSSFAFDIDSVHLLRANDNEKWRMSADVSWQLPLLFSGHRFDSLVRLRSDFYRRVVQRRNEGTHRPIDLRFVPRGSVRWRYPLIQADESLIYTLEPSVMAVVAPNGLRDDDIRDDEGRGFEWNALALFEDDHLFGGDRTESGKHIDYGLTFAAEQIEHNWSWTLFLGQSYRLDESNDFPTDSGLSGSLAHLLVSSSLALPPYWSVHYDGRLDTQKEGIVSHQVSSQLRLGRFALTSSYDLLDSGASVYDFQREEMRQSVFLDISESVRLNAAFHYDIQARQTLAYQARINYLIRDCLGIGLDFRRSFIRDRDYVPSDMVIFTINFKHLGNISFR